MSPFLFSLCCFLTFVVFLFCGNNYHFKSLQGSFIKIYSSLSLCCKQERPASPRCDLPSHKALCSEGPVPLGLVLTVDIWNSQYLLNKGTHIYFYRAPQTVSLFLVRSLLFHLRSILIFLICFLILKLLLLWNSLVIFGWLFVF